MSLFVKRRRSACRGSQNNTRPSARVCLSRNSRPPAGSALCAAPSPHDGFTAFYKGTIICPTYRTTSPGCFSDHYHIVLSRPVWKGRQCNYKSDAIYITSRTHRCPDFLEVSCQRCQPSISWWSAAVSDFLQSRLPFHAHRRYSVQVEDPMSTTCPGKRWLVSSRISGRVC